MSIFGIINPTIKNYQSCVMANMWTWKSKLLRFSLCGGWHVTSMSNIISQLFEIKSQYETFTIIVKDDIFIMIMVHIIEVYSFLFTIRIKVEELGGLSPREGRWNRHCGLYGKKNLEYHPHNQKFRYELSIDKL